MTVGELYTQLLELVTDNPDYALIPVRIEGFETNSVDLIRDEHEIYLEIQ